tara:strand:+ start:1711 stop:2022 length:312 start_codon:yes stop_codon:yes gene_type:complete
LANQQRNKIPNKYSSFGYTVWDIRRTIREAENVSRWNPWLGHLWMEEAANSLTLDAPFFAEYNAAVKRINARWLLLPRLNWFNEVEFWALDGETKPRTLLEYI